MGQKSSYDKMPRVLRRLLKLNPDLEVRKGTRHWKITRQGALLGIYPYRPSQEGFAKNTRSQLRAAGLTLPPGEGGKP